MTGAPGRSWVGHKELAHPAEMLAHLNLNNTPVHSNLLRAPAPGSFLLLLSDFTFWLSFVRRGGEGSTHYLPDFATSSGPLRTKCKARVGVCVWGRVRVFTLIDFCVRSTSLVCG